MCLLRSLALSLLVATTLACGNVETAVGIDPSDFTIEPVIYGCGAWSPGPPARDTALLDILFTSGDSSMHAPSSGDLQAVVDAGGTIVHTFHVPMARVIMPVARVSEMRANCAFGVPDATSFVIGVSVGYVSPVTNADLEYLASIGAHVVANWKGINAVLITVSDEMIPALRARSNVSYVAKGGIACLD